MPRKSTAARETPELDVARRAIQPRTGLPAGIATVFREIVASVDAAHFAAADGPLIEELAGAITISRTARTELAAAQLATPEGARLCRLLREQSKSIATLSTRLRLTPQSRISKEKAGTTAKQPGKPRPRPWEG